MTKKNPKQVLEKDQKFYSILTAIGEQNEQKAKAEKKKITFSRMAVGDANDAYVLPDRNQTALVNEVGRFAINNIQVIQAKPTDKPVLKVVGIMPDSINNVVVRELGIIANFDGVEYFHAVGNCARVFIPAPVKNAGVPTPLKIEMFFVITSTEPIINIITEVGDFVDFESDQTITGIKTFTNNIVIKAPSNDKINRLQTNDAGNLTISSADDAKNNDEGITIESDTKNNYYLSKKDIKAFGLGVYGTNTIYHDGDEILNTMPNGINISGTSTNQQNWGMFLRSYNSGTSEISHHGYRLITFSINKEVIFYHNHYMAAKTYYNSDYVGLQLSQSGNLGHNSALVMMTPSGKGGYIINSDEHGMVLLGANNQGKLQGYWTGSISPSDSSLKYNKKKLDGLGTLKLLEPCSWNWKNPEIHEQNEKGEGFTAESYQKVFPELTEVIKNEPPPVDENGKPLPPEVDENGKPLPPLITPYPDELVGKLGIKKDITGFKMNALLVDAIQTLSAQIDELKKRLLAIEDGKA